MLSIPFNAVTYAIRLKGAGMKAEIADIQAEELEHIIKNNVATKDDLKILELSLESKLKSFMVRSMITSLGVLVTLQGFMTYFIKH